jgi:hypothetical protein
MIHAVGCKARDRRGNVTAPPRLEQRGKIQRALKVADADAVFEGVFERRVDGEHLQEARDAKQPHDLTLFDDQPQLAVVLFGAALRADQRTEARRIEEIDLGEIDDQPVIAATRRFDERRTNRRRGGDVEASAELEDARSVDDADVERKVFVVMTIDDRLLARDRGRVSRRSWPVPLPAYPRLLLGVCWGGWTRTNACQSQSLVPYQLGYAPSSGETADGAATRDHLTKRRSGLSLQR